MALITKEMSKFLGVLCQAQHLWTPNMCLLSGQSCARDEGAGYLHSESRALNQCKKYRERVFFRICNAVFS